MKFVRIIFVLKIMKARPSHCTEFRQPNGDVLAFLLLSDCKVTFNIKPDTETEPKVKYFFAFHLLIEFQVTFNVNPETEAEPKVKWFSKHRVHPNRLYSKTKHQKYPFLPSKQPNFLGFCNTNTNEH